MFILAAAPLLVAAAPSWQQRTLAEAAPFIDKANSDWERAIVTGDEKLLSAAYAKNAVFVAPDGTAIHGRAGVRTMYGRRPSGTKVLSANIRSDGRIAVDPYDVYEWGSAQMRIQRKGQGAICRRPLPDRLAPKRQAMVDHAQHCLLSAAIGAVGRFIRMS
jgi:ketosteroid isomerase-like protein